MESLKDGYKGTGFVYSKELSGGNRVLVGLEEDTYVRPVERLTPARKAETRTASKV